MDSINDFLQKTFYFGVGMAAYVAEKVETLDQTVTEWQTQTQQFVNELVERGERVAVESQWHSPTADQQISQLRDRLLELTHGDEELITRLVAQTKAYNPDRDLLWVYEKVIRDLERDRGL